VLTDMLELQKGQVNGTSGTYQPFKIRRDAKYDPTIEAVGSSAELIAALISQVGFRRRKDLP
jgi:hypothetical protein